jgi:SAM-dependent methyltransferase
MDEYVAANRALWDEWAAINAPSDFYRIEEFEAGRSKLRPYELEEVGPVAGKDLLHLQCHFGLDTLSWAREGARVTGIDYSPEAIRLAREVAAELQIPATFVESDVAALPDVLQADFDVVYTSRGVLGWLPDLEAWARVIAHFLRPGGIFYITEGHPFMWLFDDEEGVGPGDLQVRYHYFPRLEPLTFPVKGSYADPEAHVGSPFEYAWQHSVGEILTALAGAGLWIEFLHEFPFLHWSQPFLVKRGDEWFLPEETEGEIPLTFSLRASKPA